MANIPPTLVRRLRAQLNMMDLFTSTSHHRRVRVVSACRYDCYNKMDPKNACLLFVRKTLQNMIAKKATGTWQNLPLTSIDIVDMFPILCDKENFISYVNNFTKAAGVRAILSGRWAPALLRRLCTTTFITVKRLPRSSSPRNPQPIICSLTVIRWRPF